MRAALLLACLLVAAPAGAESRFNGQWTIGEFRGWPEHVQVGYVLGWREHSAILSVRCAVNATNGEWIAALKYEKSLVATDRISTAMLALELRNGCTVGGK